MAKKLCTEIAVNIESVCPWSVAVISSAPLRKSCGHWMLLGVESTRGHFLK